jgi:ABC-2 type transport system permease protein
VRWLPPGSFLWLLLNEMRVSLRGDWRSNRIGVLITALFVTTLAGFAGIPVGIALHGRTIVLPPVAVAAVDIAIAVLFTLLLSQTLSSATTSLYERGDLDLLLSSPVPARRVLAVRALAIATTPLMIFLAILVPLVVPIGLLGHPRWLASIGVLICLSLAASAVGLILAMGLFSLIGPRRTRTIGQLLASFIGAGIFLASQSRYFFAGRGISFMGVLMTVARYPEFHLDASLGWPARAVTGEALPFASVVAGSIALFALSTTALGARFSRDASIAAGTDAGSRRAAAQRPAPAFRGGAFAALVRKEIVLIVRDPTLISQVFLRVLYLLPLMYIMLYNVRHQAGSAIATGTGALVFISSQISASLAWITISAEDAPDLLVSAPVSRAFAQRAKLAAALLPLLALLIVPLAYVFVISPWIGAVTTLGIIASSLSAGAINLWYESPGKRNIFRRRGSGSLVGNLGVLLLGLAWSGTTTGAAFGSVWSVLGAAVTLLVLLGFYLGRKKAAV